MGDELKEDDKKKKVDKLTSEEAVELLEDWADSWELDTERELFKVVIDELRYPVRLHKLSYDDESESFKLQLSTKIKGDKGEIHFVTIKSTTFDDKRILQRYKDDEGIDAAGAMMSKYTSLNTNQVKMLKDKDTSRINAVISGFITQTLPEKKR